MSFVSLYYTNQQKISLLRFSHRLSALQHEHVAAPLPQLPEKQAINGIPQQSSGTRAYDPQFFFLWTASDVILRFGLSQVEILRILKFESSYPWSHRMTLPGCARHLSNDVQYSKYRIEYDMLWVTSQYRQSNGFTIAGFNIAITCTDRSSNLYSTSLVIIGIQNGCRHARCPVQGDFIILDGQ